jgi:hypothetical protein
MHAATISSHSVPLTTSDGGGGGGGGGCQHAYCVGLGYYRRARLLHKGAQAVTRLHGGEVPQTIEGLLSIPGIGNYTAGAIGSIAHGLRVVRPRRPLLPPASTN